MNNADLESTIQMLDENLSEAFKTIEENKNVLLKHNTFISDTNFKLKTLYEELKDAEKSLREANNKIILLKAQLSITLAIALLSFALNFFI